MHPKLSQVTGTLAPWSHFFSGESLLAQGVFQLGSKNVIVSAGLAFNNFVIVAIVVAALYFTREILVPIALAVLLSFVLAPFVKVLQRWHLPRALAVVLAVVSALAIAVSLATMVVVQVDQLARDLPRYQTTLSDKVHNLRDLLGPTGLLKDASGLLKDLSKELETAVPEKPATPPPVLPQSGSSTRPIPVEVHQPDPGASETLVAFLQPLISPFATTGIVLIFVTFFLFQREDLRNRFIRLAGSGDLEKTTAALNDAGERLGRLFATQLILNAVFGCIIGFGLALIGVPSASLWGLLVMVLRFVPYLGVAGATTAIEDDEAASICLCYLENVSKARLDYAVRKLSRMAPTARIVVCLLADAKISAAPQTGKGPSCSLKATVAAFENHKSHPEGVVSELIS
jgi:predicted PurR-regulated permease PerM